MFVKTEIQDKIEIKAWNSNKRVAVIEGVKQKYIGKLADDLRIAIHFYDLIEIKDYEIKMEKLVTEVTFQIIFLRFYFDRGMPRQNINSRWRQVNTNNF